VTVQRHSSGGPWEDAFAYSRAVRAGDRILVSGCTAVRDGAVEHLGDPAGQARTAFGTALESVEALGGSVGDVVRTRMYVVHRSDAEAVGRVHGELFADVRPAASMLVVAGLISPELLVEVEVEAVVGLAVEHSGDSRVAGEDAP
jgi:enamine deaminase RidA (YjgF/YER057c/UK114 family)